MQTEQTVYVILVRRPTWDQDLELCRCLSAESLAGVVEAIYSASVTDHPEVTIKVRKEVA